LLRVLWASFLPMIRCPACAGCDAHCLRCEGAGWLDDEEMFLCRGCGREMPRRYEDLTMDETLFLADLIARRGWSWVLGVVQSAALGDAFCDREAERNERAEVLEELSDHCLEAMAQLDRLPRQERAAREEERG